MAHATVIAAVICLVLNVARAFGIPLPLRMVLACTAIPVAICGLAGLIEYQSWKRTALEIDRFYALKDRVSSALQFTNADPSAHYQLQVVDAFEHLKSVRPSDVVPITAPPILRWAAVLFVLALAVLLKPSIGSAEPEIDQPAPIDIAETQQFLDDQIINFEELADDAGLEAFRQLAQDLKADRRNLDSEDLTVRDTLATISQMQDKMKKMAADLNVQQMDDQLEDVAKALESAEAFKSASNALKEKAWKKAADALEGTNPKSMTRAESRPTGEQLAAASELAKDKGLDSMSETLDEMSEAVTARKSEDIEKKSLELAEQIRRHDAAQTMKNVLNSKIEALSQSKKMSINSNSEGNGVAADATGLNQKKGKSEANSDSASRKAGGKSSGNTPGEKTRLNGQLQMARLTGQLGDSGESKTETTQTTGGEQTAERMAQDTFARYKKISDAALESEAVPPGQRDTIRRYFQLIRPDSNRNSN